MELINILANPSFLASNAVVQKMITCQVIFLKVPSLFQIVSGGAFPDGSVEQTIWHFQLEPSANNVK